MKVIFKCRCGREIVIPYMYDYEVFLVQLAKLTKLNCECGNDGHMNWILKEVDTKETK